MIVSGLELDDTLIAGIEGVVVDMARVGKMKDDGRWVRGCLGRVERGFEIANRGREIANLDAWRRHDDRCGIVDCRFRTSGYKYVTLQVGRYITIT